MFNLNNYDSWGAILQLSRPDLIWMITTSRLLPFCFLAIIIISLILFALVRIFFIKKTFTFKNYILTFLGALFIYYALWVILLIIFAIALGGISQYV